MSDQPISSFSSEILRCCSLLECEVKNNPPEKINIRELYKLITAMIGAARINSSRQMEEMLFGLLNVLDGVKTGCYLFSRIHVRMFVIACVYIREMLSGQTGGTELSMQYLLEAFEKIAAELPADLDEAYIKDIIKNKICCPAAVKAAVLSPSREVSLPVEIIDKIISSADGLIINQYQLKSKMESLHDLYRIFDSVAESDPLQLRDRMEKARRRLKAIEADVKNQILKFERSAFRLQEDSLALRMLPFSVIFEDIKNHAAAISSATGCRFELLLPSGRILLDKIIIQSILPPLLSVIDNAVEHGFSGYKNRGGKITLTASDHTGKITVEIHDNGRGINFPLLREKCLALFPHDREKLADLPNAHLIKYLFIEGIGTAGQGRGFGLSGAKTALEQIKGRIIITTGGDDQGTIVKITVPKSLTNIFGYYIISSGVKFFIPSTYVNEILIVDRKQVLDLVTRQAVKIRENIIPVFPLSGIINTGNRTVTEKLNIIMIEVSGETIGIAADEILYHAAAIFKPLPANLQGTPYLQGVVLDEEFRIVNILYIPRIVEKLQNIRNLDYREKYSESNAVYKRILVVDDSPVSLDIMSRLLRRAGFQAETAGDGIEALQKIRSGNYHLVIADTDMPRMDGLTFMENLHKEKGYEKTPVIFQTSRSDEQQIRYCLSAGARAVYVKSSFSREALLHDIHNLLQIS